MCDYPPQDEHIYSDICHTCHPHTMNLLSADSRLPVTVLLCFACMMLAYTDAYPRSRVKRRGGDRQNRDVIGRSSARKIRPRNCRPVPDEVLWQRLGPYVDDSVMSTTDFNLSPDRERAGNVAARQEVSRFHDGLDEPEVFSHRRLLSVSRTNSSARAAHSTRHKRKSRAGGRSKHRKSSSGKRGGGRKQPPWHCELHEYTLKMKKGFYPPFIKTGRCSAAKNTKDTCMGGMFQCKPKKYVIRVLKRLSGECRPVPREGGVSVYEEAWTLVPITVRVACECSAKRTNNQPYDPAWGRELTAVGGLLE